MNTSKKLWSIAFLAITSIVGVQSAQTNLVQALNFKFTIITQGATVTNGNLVSFSAVKQSVVTKDVINWLGVATTNVFINGQLLVINELNTLISNNHIIVRTATRTTTNDVDVSDFFGSFTYASTVNNFSYNNSNNIVNPGTYYGYWGFYLRGDSNHPLLPANFEVTGLGIDAVSYITAPKKKVVLGVGDLFSITNSAGTGQFNGAPFLVTGSIIISGKAIEVDQNP